MDNIRLLDLDGFDGPIPMGANLLTNGEGATFKAWAPAAREVRVRWDYIMNAAGAWSYQKEACLQKLDGGDMWGGFVPDLEDGDRYMFYVVGPENGDEGIKRDPYARDLSDVPAWPDCQCLLTDPDLFVWHDGGFRPPPFNELVIYQFHIGTWYIPEGQHHGRFLDVLAKLPYLKALGINAIQPLPVIDFLPCSAWDITALIIFLLKQIMAFIKIMPLC